MSSIDVRRDAVEGYELADARTIDRRLVVSSVVGTSLASICWNKSGCFESKRGEQLLLASGANVEATYVVLKGLGSLLNWTQVGGESARVVRGA